MALAPQVTPPLGPLLGASFDRAFTIIGRSWKSFALVSAIAVLAGAFNFFLGFCALAGFVTYWYYASLANAIRLEDPSYAMDAGVVIRLIGLGIVYGLVVEIGFFLLLIPGIYVANIWSLAPLILVKEKLGVGEALQRSGAVIGPVFWPTLGFNILAGLAVFAVAFAGIVIGEAVFFGVLSASGALSGHPSSAAAPAVFAGPLAMAIVAAYAVYFSAIAYTYQAKDVAMLNWYNGLRRSAG